MFKLSSRVRLFAGTCLSGIYLAGACTFNTSNEVANDGASERIRDARTTDARARTDAPVPLADAAPVQPDAPPPDAMPCVGATFGFTFLNIDSCDPIAPTTQLDLNQSGTYLLDSDTGTLTDPLGAESSVAFRLVSQGSGSSLFVTAATSISVQSQTQLRLIGSHPIVLLSTSDILIDGQILANAQGARSGGGGNDDSDCAAGRGSSGVVQASDHGDNAGSGGGGGGFKTAGGFGARVQGSASPNTNAGPAASNTALEPLRGGCAGGSGGMTGGGAGGGGGGAFQLIARNSITLSGRLSVSGGGGQSVSGQSSGGGGGGSGGAILLQASTMSNPGGHVTLNGGGGSAGSRFSPNSQRGSDGSVTSNAVATGGNGIIGTTGPGGDGATIATLATDGAEGFSTLVRAAGGSGGGGGRGVLRIELVSP